MAYSYITAPELSQGREERRHAANREIIAFLNNHRDLFSSADTKNGQGLVTIYALHKLMEQSSDNAGFSSREIANYIRENELWFEPSIKKEGEVFSEDNGSLSPYWKKIDGIDRVEVMYYIGGGEFRISRISNFIMKTIKSNVLSPTRAHNLIRRLVNRDGQETYSVHFPRYLPPSNLSTERAIELNRIIFEPEMSQRDQDFLEYW